MSIAQKRPFASTINDFTQSKINESLINQGQVLPCTVTAVNGAIVTVNFEVLPNAKITLPPVTCPIAESTYVRLPVQVGDKGICIAASTRLGGVSGLGSGLAPFSNPSNLGGLVFVPIGNKNWSAVDPNAVNINAPNGAVIRDTNNNSTITLTPSNITIVRGSTQIVINDSGVVITNHNTGVTINGNLTVNGLISGNAGFNISGGSGATMQVTGDINQTGSFSNTGGVASDGNVAAGGDVTGGSISLVNHIHGGVATGGGNTGKPV